MRLWDSVKANLSAVKSMCNLVQTTHHSWCGRANLVNFGYTFALPHTSNKSLKNITYDIWAKDRMCYICAAYLSWSQQWNNMWNKFYIPGSCVGSIHTLNSVPKNRKLLLCFSCCCATSYHWSIELQLAFVFSDAWTRLIMAWSTIQSDFVIGSKCNLAYSCYKPCSQF